MAGGSDEGRSLRKTRSGASLGAVDGSGGGVRDEAAIDRASGNEAADGLGNCRDLRGTFSGASSKTVDESGGGVWNGATIERESADEVDRFGGKLDALSLYRDWREETA